MKDASRTRKSIIIYILTLILGFAGLTIPAVFHPSYGSGIAAFIWIAAFIYAVCVYRNRFQFLITGFVFLAGYYIKFAGASGKLWLNLAVFVSVGLILYGIFILYSFIITRFNRFFATLILPVLWTAAYLLASLVRLPSVLRPDIMFTDMNVLIQAESLIGSLCFSFILIWIESLAVFAIVNRRYSGLILSSVLITALILVGIITLYPNRTYSKSICVAYTTGPYVGDFIDYTEPDLDTSITNMETAARSAAEKEASILVFTEEAFTINDSDEEMFTEKCCRAAAENKIHILAGLDITDTDGSENGKSLDKAVWIDSSGNVIDSYTKKELIPVIESGYAAGNGEIPSHTILIDDEEITVSYLICYESNFPQYVNTMNPDTDILFIPSWDWKAVTELHAELCRTIAVENNVSVIKPTYDGKSVVIDPKGVVIQSSDTEDSGFGQVLTAQVPLKNSVVYESTAATVSGSTYGIIATELLSLLICVILLISNWTMSRTKTRRIKIFHYIIVSNIIGMASDAVSWILDGHNNFTVLLYITSGLSCLITIVMMMLFTSYLDEYIKEKRHTEQSSLRGYYILMGIIIIFTIVSMFCGKLFTFENGFYSDGEFYNIYVVLNILVLFIGIIYIFRNRKILGYHDCVASYLYLCFPIVSSAINMFVPDFSYAYPAITVSCLLVYLMIQSDQKTSLETKEQLSTYYASHDELTGLFNRRAYMEKLLESSSKDGCTGVIFSDLNGLKYTNDTFGHIAGDNLLKQYAGILSEHFKSDCIFRISGDEFIVILPDISRSSFVYKIEELKKDLSPSGTLIASIGSEYGQNSEITDLIKEAEAKMYREKENFHKTNPR